MPIQMEGRAKKRVALEIDFPRDRRQSGEVENSAKEKETANAISLSEGCAYTPVMVEVTGLAPAYQRKTI